MKRTLAALALITVIALSIATWFVHNQLQDPINTPDVKITNLSVDTRWANLVGVSLFLFFNITIQNMQTGDIHDVTLVVKMKGLDENVCTNYTEKFDVLHAGESKDVVMRYIDTSYDHISEVVDSDFVATVKLGETVLDERVIRSTNNAKITAFSADGPDTSVADVVLWKFNVTIQNEGGNDINGMTLAVRMRQNSMIIAESTKQLSTLHIGEIQKIETAIEGGIELSGLKEEYAITAILTLSNGNIIVDQYKIP